MKIQKIRAVKNPCRGTNLSAGIDFFVPDFSDTFISDLLEINNFLRINTDKNVINLPPHKRILIPSGIKVNFQGEPKALIVFNKSGISVKKGLDALACVIDQDYQGEIHFSLVNTSDEDVIINEGEKIVQMLMLPVLYENIQITDENIWNEKTERGEGGFGSTGSH